MSGHRKKTNRNLPRASKAQQVLARDFRASQPLPIPSDDEEDAWARKAAMRNSSGDLSSRSPPKSRYSWKLVIASLPVIFLLGVVVKSVFRSNIGQIFTSELIAIWSRFLSSLGNNGIYSYFKATSYAIWSWFLSSLGNIANWIYSYFYAASYQLYCDMLGCEKVIERVLIASTNIDGAATFITAIRAWTESSFNDRESIVFIAMAMLPIQHKGYGIANALKTVENLDADTIVSVAREENVDAVWAEEDPRVRDALEKLGIRFIAADSPTAAEMILNDVVASIEQNRNEYIPISIESPPELNSSSSRVTVSTIEIHDNPPFPLVMSTNSRDNRVKLISDKHGNRIAIDRSSTVDIAVTELHIAMGLQLDAIPQVREYLGGHVDNGIDHVDFRQHIYVLTAEVPPGRSNMCAPTLSACVYVHDHGNSHLVVTGETRAITIDNTMKAVDFINGDLRQNPIWTNPSQELLFEPATSLKIGHRRRNCTW
jgi:hypothetical protein